MGIDILTFAVGAAMLLGMVGSTLFGMARSRYPCRIQRIKQKRR
jgi:hypothetical protein